MESLPPLSLFEAQEILLSPFVDAASLLLKVSLFLLNDIPKQFVLDVLTIGRLFGLRGRRTYGSVIRTDPLADWVTVVGMVFFVLVLIFALDFDNLLFIGASSGTLLMQLSGESINRKAGPPIARQGKPKLGGLFVYIVVDLGLFAALDIIGANAASLPGLGLSTLSLGHYGQLFTVGPLFSVQIAISEEVFFRLGLANYGSKYGGPPLGIFSSAVFFFFFHVPAYSNDGLKLMIIGADGAVMAWSDFDTANVLPSIFAHVLNNLIVVLAALAIGAGAVGI